MKKWIACVLAVTALCVLLCGCGAGMDGNSAVVETPLMPAAPSMTMSPMPTPNAEDGIVDDEDGFIDGREEPRQAQPSPSATVPGTKPNTAS